MIRSPSGSAHFHSCHLFLGSCRDINRQGAGDAAALMLLSKHPITVLPPPTPRMQFLLPDYISCVMPPLICLPFSHRPSFFFRPISHWIFLPKSTCLLLPSLRLFLAAKPVKCLSYNLIPSKNQPVAPLPLPASDSVFLSSCN